MNGEHAIRLVLSGRVQGVGFRWWLAHEAAGLPVRGWVRNLPDGRVEIVAAGDEDSLRQIESLATNGPRVARVDHVEKANVPHEDVDVNSFSII
jgi:acylphosphatase